MLMGMKMMNEVGLNTSVQASNISGEPEVQVLMVPGNYWTESWIRHFAVGTDTKTDSI